MIFVGDAGLLGGSLSSFPFPVLCKDDFRFSVVGHFLLQNAFSDLCFFAFGHLTVCFDSRLVSKYSQVIKPPKVGSVVHSDPFTFSLPDLMLEDVPDHGLELLGLFIKGGLGDDRRVVQVASFPSGTP